MKVFFARLRRHLHHHREWQEEVDSHLAMRAELNQSAGMGQDEARFLARRQFGNRSLVMEELRAVHIGTWLESVLQDVAYALRGFRKYPLFALIAVLTLAIGIGATTAVFSVVDPLLFRALPYGYQNRLVSIGLAGPIDPNEFMLGRQYVEFQNLLRAPFDSVTTISPPISSDLGEQNPIQVRSVPVQANLLATLGVKVAAGNDFTTADDQPNAPPVVLLSYGLWKSRFAGSDSILRKTIVLDDTPARIVGVLPKNFELPTLQAADLLVPQRLYVTQQLRSPTGRFLRAFARLKPAVSEKQAREQLRPFLTAALTEVPPQLRREVRLAVRSLRDRQFHDIRLASWMLFGAVLALLLIACANVANLLLARAAARQTELALRRSLGAGGGRLFRQSLTESLVLACSGGIVGSIFALVLFRVLGTLPPQGILRLKETALDPRILVFTFLTCIIGAVLFGIAPAVQNLSGESLAQSRPSGRRRPSLRNALVISQIAISIVLLTGTSLFVRSLWKLENQAIGFQPSYLAAASFELNRHRYNTPEKLNAFYSGLETKLRTMTGVGAFALSDSIPPAGPVHQRPFSNISILGKPPLPSEGGMVDFRYVTPDYFRVLSIPILMGRAFNERDRTPSQNSIILSAKLARRMFGDSNPLGQEVVGDPDTPARQVIGVAADVNNNGLPNSPLPEYYLVRKPHRDLALGYQAVILVRSRLSATALDPWLRAQIAQLDSQLPLTVETMTERVDNENKRPKFLTILVGLFAAFGLLLAAIGLYGVISFLISQRTREIGIRMAIGATPGDIASLVLRRAFTWTIAGTILGLFAAFAFARLLRGLLFDISPYDPASLIIAVLILEITALIATLRPSRRAAKIDPSTALRWE